MAIYWVKYGHLLAKYGYFGHLLAKYGYFGHLPGYLPCFMAIYRGFTMFSIKYGVFHKIQ